MCGRFVQHADPELYASRYDIETVCTAAPRYNVAPTQPVLAIRQTAAGRRELVALRWGLVPHWSSGINQRYSMINARAESVHQRPAYRDAFRRRRCLIPAEGFYEWVATDGGKQPYLIRQVDGAPFTMAGLWESWRDPARPDGPRVESCTIVVTDANALLAPLHDRMPVILSPEVHAQWLDPTRPGDDGIRALLRPAATGGWTYHPVSTAVNSPRNDGPSLMEPSVVDGAS